MLCCRVFCAKADNAVLWTACIRSSQGLPGENREAKFAKKASFVSVISLLSPGYQTYKKDKFGSRSPRARASTNSPSPPLLSPRPQNSVAMLRLRKTFLLPVLASIACRALSTTCRGTVSFAVGSFTVLRDRTFEGAGITFATLENGSLNVTAVLPAATSGETPAYLAASPPYIYAANTLATGGALRRIAFSSAPPFVASSSVSSEAATATHVSVLPPKGRVRSRGIVLTASFDGSVASYVSDGENFFLADQFKPPLSSAAQRRNSSLSRRQSVPHPHMVLPYRGGALVPDLGSDVVWNLGVSPRKAGLSLRGSVTLRPGDGPRHAVVHPELDVVYVLNEISVSVVVLKRSCGQDRRLGECGRERLLDEQPEERALAAAIRVSPDGKFLYATVRIAGSKGRIVGFALSRQGDIVEKLGEWSSQGVLPWDAFLVENVRDRGKCKSFVAVVNRDSNSLVLLPRDVASGLVESSSAQDGRLASHSNLVSAAYEVEVGSPSSVLAY